MVYNSLSFCQNMTSPVSWSPGNKQYDEMVTTKITILVLRYKMESKSGRYMGIALSKRIVHDREGSMIQVTMMKRTCLFQLVDVEDVSPFCNSFRYLGFAISCYSFVVSVCAISCLQKIFEIL